MCSSRYQQRYGCGQYLAAIDRETDCSRTRTSLIIRNSKMFVSKIQPGPIVCEGERELQAHQRPQRKGKIAHVTPSERPRCCGILIGCFIDG
jgi:hypothetical protein